MKIVGFETDAGLRLGVVEADQVVDLQAVDADTPCDLGVLLARTNGDLSALRDLVARASSWARVNTTNPAPWMGSPRSRYPSTSCPAPTP